MPGLSDLDGWMRLALGALATWRVAHLLAYEDGPADLVVGIRARLGQGAAGRWMDCVQCVSVWVAAPVAFIVAPGPTDRILAWLGLSGAACVLDRMTEGADTNGMLRSETGGAETLDPDGGRIVHASAGGKRERSGAGAAGPPVLHGPRVHDGPGTDHRPRV